MKTEERLAHLELGGTVNNLPGITVYNNKGRKEWEVFPPRDLDPLNP